MTKSALCPDPELVARLSIPNADMDKSKYARLPWRLNILP